MVRAVAYHLYRKFGKGIPGSMIQPRVEEALLCCKLELDAEVREGDETWCNQCMQPGAARGPILPNMI